MPGLYADDLVLQQRDLSGVLSTINSKSPTLISFFPGRNPATNRKHEWLEDQITGRSLTVSSVSSSTVTASAADIAKLKAGMQFVIKDDTALFEVSSISGSTFNFSLLAAHGSTTTTPAAGDVLKIVAYPNKEGSVNGDGEQSYWASGTDYNFIQIVRKEIQLTRTAQATNTYDGSNSIDRQTAFALQGVSDDLNRIALFGARRQGSTSVNGAAGGLYEFGTQTGGLAVNANSATFDSFVVNDAAQAMIAEGAKPSVILCGPGQARVLANERKKEVQIVRGDEARGVFVARVVNEVNGSLKDIVSEPDMPDAEAWLLDPAGFGLVPLQGNALRDEDATPKGTDGFIRVALGHYTLEFKNAKQRLCRIKALKGSAAAIAAYKAG